ncbi:MAG: hypothetical protein M1840_003264 [Geoglossum simile]|nr:MAG: hypothetical protein M1840_003264 [Geoglossum simile]
MTDNTVFLPMSSIHWTTLPPLVQSAQEQSQQLQQPWQPNHSAHYPPPLPSISHNGPFGREQQQSQQHQQQQQQGAMNDITGDPLVMQNGLGGFPSYILSLSPKKRDKALIPQKRYDSILSILKDPKCTTNESAQFR